MPGTIENFLSEIVMEVFLFRKKEEANIPRCAPSCKFLERPGTACFGAKTEITHFVFSGGKTEITHFSFCSVG